MAAATAALNTAELLEIILLGLPTRDLLLSQRVCKTWHQAIGKSKLIRQALFFEPISLRADKCKFMLTQDDNGEWPSFTLYPGHYLSVTPHHEHPTFVNPLIGDFVGKYIPSKDEISRGVQTQDLAASLEPPRGAIPWETLTDPECSIRKMLATQPAMKSLEICVNAACEAFTVRLTLLPLEISNESGVTAGDVFEAILLKREEGLDRRIPHCAGFCKDAFKNGGRHPFPCSDHASCKLINWTFSFHVYNREPSSTEGPSKYGLQLLKDNTGLDTLRGIVRSSAIRRESQSGLPPRKGF